MTPLHKPTGQKRKFAQIIYVVLLKLGNRGLRGRATRCELSRGLEPPDAVIDRALCVCFGTKNSWCRAAHYHAVFDPDRNPERQRDMQGDWCDYVDPCDCARDGR